MPATIRPLYIEQGATFYLSFTWHEDGPIVDGELTPGDPVDLSGWTARTQVRDAVGGAVLLSATTSTQGSTIALGGVTGSVVVKFTAADTDAVTAQFGVYDLELVAPSGDVHRLLQGTVTFDPNVTREDT